MVVNVEGMMKKTILCLTFILIFLTGCTSIIEVDNDVETNFKIVTSFYPIYMQTLLITNGAVDVSVENMADTHGGCLHNYTLNTKDLIKLENADVFVTNGLGLENFMEKVSRNISKS